jgi:phage shock protein PspC (stress-responsive transcriptional regulator)
MKTLAKIQQDKWLGGVCSGFAYMLGVPAWYVRLATCASVLLFGAPILVYLLLWVFMPRWHMDPTDYAARTQRIYDGELATPPAPASAATVAPSADVPATDVQSK